MNHDARLSPEDLLTHASRRQQIVDWWIALEMGGDAGAASWGVLDVLRDRVTACLGCDPPDILSAEGFTAQAMLLLSGFDEH
jgi:hypothetical protein